MGFIQSASAKLKDYQAKLKARHDKVVAEADARAKVRLANAKTELERERVKLRLAQGKAKLRKDLADTKLAIRKAKTDRREAGGPSIGDSLWKTGKRIGKDVAKMSNSLAKQKRKSRSKPIRKKQSNPFVLSAKDGKDILG